MTILINFLIPLMVSTILLYFSEKKSIVINSRKINKFIIIIALIIPAIVASSRLIIDVGDSKLYGETIFNYAQNNTWRDYYDYFHNNYFSFESGFLLLTFVIGQFTSNYHILFFAFSFINVILIYDGLNKLKPYIKFDNWNAMIVFYLLFFGQTLNIVRQSLGIAIVFWGLHYVFEKKPLKFFIVVLIAMQFHISSALAIALYFLYYIIRKCKNKKNMVCLISICCLIVVMGYSKVFLFLQGLNILPSKFFSLYYINGLPFSPFAIVTKGPLILIFLIFILSKSKNKYFNEIDEWYFFLLLCFDLIISQLAGENEYLYRMALVFAYIKIPYFAIYSNKKLRKFLIFYCFIDFYMEYIYQGALPIDMFIK